MTAYQTAVLADAPLAYYPCGDASGTVATDASGNGNNGTYTGGVTLGQASLMSSEATTAALLDGSTGYISFPSAVNIYGWTALTLEGILRFASTRNNDSRFFANEHTDSNNNGVELVINSQNGTGFGDVGSGTGAGYASWSSALATSKSYHYALVYNNANVIVYLSGVAVATSSFSGAISNSAYLLNVGRNPAYNGDYELATVGHLAVYNSALSASRIGVHVASMTQAQGALATGLQWLTSLLGGDATILANAPGGVWKYFAPPGTPTPYIILQPQSLPDILTANATRVYSNDTFQVKAVGPQTNYSALITLSSRINALINPTHVLTVPGGTILSCFREQELSYAELVNGQLWNHLGGLFRLQIQ